MKEALEKNPGLEAARATLSRSQNILRAGYGVFVPQVDLRANASRQLYNGSAVGIPSNTYNLYSVSGTVSYPLDIWGGERRQVEGLAAAVDEQRFALGGAYVMLTTNVVQTVIAQAAYGDQIELAKETIVALEQQVRIALAQSVAGTAPYSNVLTLQAQLASTQATLPPLQNRIDQASHLLAALTGRTPANWK
ncbi:MAG: TolC family protein, partial [Polyangiales bacterium]